MSEKIILDLVTPKELVSSKEVVQAVIPGAEGDFGVLVDHAPLISTIRPGVIDIYENNNSISDRIFVTGGFAEVNGKKCTVLAKQAFDLKGINKTQAQEMLRQAKEDLALAKDEKSKEKAAKNIETANLLIEVL